MFLLLFQKKWKPENKFKSKTWVHFEYLKMVPQRSNCCLICIIHGGPCSGRSRINILPSLWLPAECFTTSTLIGYFLCDHIWFDNLAPMAFLYSNIIIFSLNWYSNVCFNLMYMYIKCMGTRTFFTPSNNGAAVYFSVNEHGVSTFFRTAEEMFFSRQLVVTLFFSSTKTRFFKA